MQTLRGEECWSWHFAFKCETNECGVIDFENIGGGSTDLIAYPTSTAALHCYANKYSINFADSETLRDACVGRKRFGKEKPQIDCLPSKIGKVSAFSSTPSSLSPF